MVHSRKSGPGILPQIRGLFSKAGIRLTPQRLEILEEITSSRAHPSAEKVFRRVRPRMPTLSLDTVYRTLDRFERMGLISRVEVLDDQVRYDPVTEPHHHLVCVKCKGMQDFTWTAFDAMKPPPSAAEWGRTARRHVEIRGICARCSARERA